MSDPVTTKEEVARFWEKVDKRGLEKAAHYIQKALETYYPAKPAGRGSR